MPASTTRHERAGTAADRKSQRGTVDALLSPEEAAERLGTSVRFIRRLIFERRISFTKLGRYVRIAASDLEEFIAAGRVEAVTVRDPHLRPSAGRR